MYSNKKIYVIIISVTIIVALVIMAIAIRGASGNGLINDMDDTTIKYVQAQEESTLRMQVSQWQISAKYTMSLEAYLKKEYGDKKVERNNDGSVTVEASSGNKFKVTESGGVTLVK